LAVKAKGAEASKTLKTHNEEKSRKELRCGKGEGVKKKAKMV